jgi:hypothetical protein
MDGNQSVGKIESMRPERESSEQFLPGEVLHASRPSGLA